jgi:hypothetical protein
MLTGAFVLALSTACSRVPPLANIHASANDVAVAALDALARRDRAALESLALSETEFRDHVWPELPAARPERNLPFSFVWGDLHQKSLLALGGTLAAHGGRRYTLVGVTSSGRTSYNSYTVHRETTLRVKDPSGELTDLRICGSMLEKGGAWKIFSFVVSE